MRPIDADKLCVDLMERWDIADKQKEKLIIQVMADIVTPIVVSQPPVELERKKGKWIWQTFSRYMCSECGRITNVDECMEEPMYTYCPYCGAPMVVEEEM